MSGRTVKFIIKGVTADGRKFRPSDWAQRLVTAVAVPGPGRHIRFHPKVSMSTVDGVDCVVVDAGLEQEEPLLFAFLINFGRDNRLEIVEVREGG